MILFALFVTSLAAVLAVDAGFYKAGVGFIVLALMWLALAFVRGAR